MCATQYRVSVVCLRLLHFDCCASKRQSKASAIRPIMDYIPENVYRVVRVYSKQRQTIPYIYTKVRVFVNHIFINTTATLQLYMYQLMRALAYIHSLGICHRDIKPQNLLLDPDSAVLKLCDFGSAKHLVRGEPNVSYICSRYYRAPELIFGATDYQTNIGLLSVHVTMFIAPSFRCVVGRLCARRTSSRPANISR